MVDWRTLVAGYAAGVSTIVGARQLLTDLPRVNVSVMEDAQVYGGPPRTPPEDVISLTVTNAGRRPAIITAVAFMPPKRGWSAFPGDWLRELPIPLREGEYRTLVLYKRHFTSEKPAPPKGSTWFVQDSLHHTWPRAARWRLRMRRLGNWWRKKARGEDPWEAARRLRDAAK